MPTRPAVLEHFCAKEAQARYECLPSNMRLLTWNRLSWWLTNKEHSPTNDFVTWPDWKSLLSIWFCPFCGERITEQRGDIST